MKLRRRKEQEEARREGAPHAAALSRVAGLLSDSHFARDCRGDSSDMIPAGCSEGRAPRSPGKQLHANSTHPRSLTRPLFFFSTSSASLPLPLPFPPTRTTLSLVLPSLNSLAPLFSSSPHLPPPQKKKTVHRPHRRGGRGARRLRRVGRRPRRRRDRRRAAGGLFPPGERRAAARVGRVCGLGPVTSAPGRMSAFVLSLPARHHPDPVV